MTERDLQQRERFVRIISFAAQHAADFPAGKTAAQHIDELKAVVSKFDTMAGSQSQNEGAGRAATIDKHALVAAVREDLVGLSRVARALERERPGLREQFPLPRSQSDEVQIATARAALQNLADDPTLLPLFLDYGMPGDFVADLRDDIEAAEAADANQDNHTGARREDTLAIAAVIQDGVSAVEKLDAYAQNIYRSDRVLLGAWKSASHFEVRRVHRVASVKKPAA